MGRINVLEKQVAEMIAAGEVVERPSSIAKELLENAIDAGASVITAEIRGGGIRYLRVTDNGCGIDRDDVPRAFLRHATSKVRESGDLNHIMTMGFRGEALASIAAMCRVEMITRTAEEMAGTCCVIEGGEQISLEDTGCPAGTTIVIRDVFYNTPARMKFLKKDVTEGNSVQAVVEKAALAEPGISFRFLRDGVMKLQTPGDGDPLSAVRAIFGREFAQKVLPVRYSYGSLSLEGLVCYPEIARASRSMQNFFINRRFVHSKTCMAAIEEAYKGILMTGKFPACILYLTVPPQAVDVNVHPAKTEVRFASEKDIFSLVYYGCKTALGTVNLAPEITVQEKRPNPFISSQSPSLPKQQQINENKHIQTAASSGGTIHINAQEYHRIVSPSSSNDKPSKIPRRLLDISTDEGDLILCSPDVDAGSGQIKDTVGSPASVPFAPQGEHFQEKTESKSIPKTGNMNKISPCKESNFYDNVRIVGEIFSTYILLEGNDEFIIVDKHAAHERLLFNKLMGQGIGEERQMLLEPVTVHLSAEEYSAAAENLELLGKAGITADDFGNGCILVREIAPVLSGLEISDIITEFAQKLLRGNERLVSQHMENLFHTVACRAAVKAGDKLAIPSLEELIMLMQQDGEVSHCPHGRPVAIRMSRHTLEKKFGRLG